MIKVYFNYMVHSFAIDKLGTKASCSAHFLVDRLVQLSRGVYFLTQDLKFGSS
jgi:hypothetical protein